MRFKLRVDALPILLSCTLIFSQACGPAVSDEPAPSRDGAYFFTEVTAEAGLGSFTHATGALGEMWFPETMGSGAGFIDFNGDDWADILLVGGGSWSEDEHVPAVRLYRNEQDGTFTDITEAAGLAGVSAYGFGITAGDFDNDGDQDFFLTTLRENLLFRNDGGRFTEYGRAAGVADRAVWSTAALFFDADRDGWLDLYVGNYVAWSPQGDIFCTVDGETKAYCQPTLYEGVPANFYRNDGDGTFTEQSLQVGLGGAPGKTLGVTAFDYNRDGSTDLFVANDMQRDLLFENDDGSFIEKGVLSGVAFSSDGSARGGMGVDAGVADATGRESIFVGNFSNEMIGVYRHQKSGLFTDRAATSRIGRPSLRKVTFGLFLFDADLDGDLDLFAANGNIREESDAQSGVPYRQEAQLFVNDGDGRFTVAEPASDDPLAEPLVARGAAYADYDRDGDLDILLTENGGPAHLWRNETAGGNAFRVHVQGRESNRDGLGTEIEIFVNGARMHRYVRSGSSYLSQSEHAVTFGVGAAARIDTVIARWPSGRVDRFAGVAVPQEIRLTEGRRDYVTLSDAAPQDLTP